MGSEKLMRDIYGTSIDFTAGFLVIIQRAGMTQGS